MEEKDLQQTARAVRDAGRAEDLEHVKSAIWQNLPPAPSPTPHRWKAVIATGAAGMTVAGIAVALATFWLPGAPLSPAPAFADVEKAMLAVKTAQWTQTRTRVQPFGHKSVERAERFLRLGEHPLLVSIADDKPGEDPVISSDDGKTVLTLFPSWREKNGYTYMAGTSRNGTVLRQNSTPAKQLESLILFPKNVDSRSPGNVITRESLSRVHWETKHTPWRSTPATLDSKPTLRWDSIWSSRYTGLPLEKGRARSTFTDARTMRVWVDPKTFLVLRREIEIHVGPGYTISELSENFRYNDTADQRAFHLPTPPLNVAFRFSDYTEQGFKTAQPTRVEKAQMTQTVRQAVAAWNRQDAAAFNRAWSWEGIRLAGQFYKRLVGESYRGIHGSAEQITVEQKKWQRRVASRAPYVRWRVNRLRYADAANSLFVRRKPSDPFPPTGRPTCFAVLAQGEAQLKPGGPWVPADTVFYMYRDGNRFGITIADMFKYRLTRRDGAANFK